MMDRLGDHFSLFSLLESLSLGWYICFAACGLAYYTNPSEKSFKSFLDQFSIPTEQSLQKTDHHLNRGSSAIARNKSKTHQQQSPKVNPANRNLKNFSPSSSASSPQGSFPSLSTSPYNRHNLLLCTLISVDRTRNLSLHLSFDRHEDESYPSLEWFFGCFDTWFALRRQIPLVFTTLPILSIHQRLKTIWNQWPWPIPDVLLPQKLLIDNSLQELSPLIKPKRKKSHRSPKPHSLRCQTSDLCDHSTECSTPERLFTSPTSARESDCYSSQLTCPNSESSHLLKNPVLFVGLPLPNNSPQAAHPSPSMPTSPDSVSRISATNELPESIDLSDDVACDSLTRPDLLPSSDRSTDPLPPSSCDLSVAQHSIVVLEPKSPAPSDPPQLHQNENPSSSVDAEKKSKEPKPKVIHEHTDKTQHQSSPKHLNEAKYLKDLKQSNSNEKQDQSKSPQTHVLKQPAKPKAEVWVAHRKSPSTSNKCKKEESTAKLLARPIKAEAVKLPRAKDPQVIKKNESKEKLATRQAEPNRKREVNQKQAKSPNNRVVTRTVDRQSPLPDPEVRHPVMLVPHHSFGSPSPPPPDRAANLPVNMLPGISMTSIPPISESMMPSHLDNFNSSVLLHDVLTHYPVSDPWAPDPWSETDQQSHIRDSFISLPNLERSALKDHHPILRGMDHAPPLHSFPSSPLIEDAFLYQQELNLSSPLSNIPEWPCPPLIQTSFGAIGQQGSETPALLHPSPVLSSALFRFPGPPAHSPHLIENAFLARPNSARKENLSRTSSTNSLPQLPGYRSNHSSPSQSPYAPIGTPLHSRHSALNEVCERPGESLGGVNMACCLNGGTIDPFEVPEATLTTHCTAMSRIAQSLLPFDSTTSTVRNPVPPIKAMKKVSPGMSGHHTTQSLNAIQQPMINALNSIFDVGPEKDFPTLQCSSTPKRTGQSLNPSAKVFAFGGSKAACGQLPFPPPASLERQRSRGYSQSTIPSSSSCFHKPINSSNLSNKEQNVKDGSKNLLKSLHRSSWSVVLDFKGIVSSVQDLKPQRTEISNIQFGESSSRPANRTSVLSELSMLSSSEEVLPAARSKSACSGLFGSIGDMKTKKTSASSSANVSPLATPPVLGPPFFSSPQVTA